MNMLETIIPKSSQLNADDLLGGPRTITVTKVELTSEEQPVAVSFDGDGGKPFLPGKSMRRVMVNAWGPDASAYVGRSMTLYRDEKVQFGGLAVGGIRISHMSHITRPITMALTASRSNRKPFTVQPLAVAAPAAVTTPVTSTPPPETATPEPPPPPAKKRTMADVVDDIDAMLSPDSAETAAAVALVIASDRVVWAVANAKGDVKTRLDRIVAAARARTSPVPQEHERRLDGIVAAAHEPLDDSDYFQAI